MTKMLQIKSKLICLQQGHMQQSIDYLCIEDQCPYQKLGCFLCNQQNHKSHSMLSVKILLTKILDIKKYSSQSLYTSASIDATVIEIANFLKKVQQQFTDYNLIVYTFYKCVQTKKNKIMNMFQLPKYLQRLLDLSAKQFQKQLKVFFQNNNQLLSIEEDQDSKHKNVYMLALQSISNQVKDILKSLNRLNNQNRINDYEVLSLFPIEQQFGLRSFRPHFSQNYKGTCMKITVTSAQMTVSSSQRVLALEPSLENGSKIKKWKFKIVKLASWIGIGACHLNKLKEANWFFNYSNTQHGSYFISSNGYSWSSHKPEKNSKLESFSFKTGDVILVEFNLRQKKLKYQKQDTNQKYELDIEINGDPLHPAVNLTGLGDSVQLI